MARRLRFNGLCERFRSNHKRLSGNNRNHVKIKKRGKPTEREINTAVFFLRAKQIGLTMDDLEELSVGFVTDLIIEGNNDKCEYRTLAEQSDFDSF